MIDILKDMTLGELIDQVATINPNNEALVFKDLRLNYRELQNKVNQLAKGLLEIGVKKGDKVSIWVSNRPDWIYTKFAVAKIGAVLVPVNTRFKTHELEYILKNSDSTTLVMMDNFLNIDFIKMIQEVCPEINSCQKGKLNSPNVPFLKNIIAVSDKKYDGMFNFSEVMDMGSNSSLDDELQRIQSSVKPDDIVNIQYTSGTTGPPRGVMHAHHMVSHMFLVGERAGCMANDRMIIFLPLFHIFGNCSALLVAITHGACFILQEYFDAEESLKLMVQERCTYINCVPTTIIMMLNHPSFPKYRDQLCLQKGIIGGAPAPVQLILDMVEKMGIVGISAGYGQTECCGFTSYSVKGDSHDVVASMVGKPTTDYEVKIVDIHTGKPVPLGEQGELLVRGKAVMKGYYKMPEETAKALEKDGWCHSGDLFIMDKDGNLKITGRTKDIYISGGENVAPAEVENFLFKYPKIKQVQIVGVPDQRLGEVGAAFVELKEGEKATGEEIINFCKGKIANFKIPKYVRFVKEFPLTASGKIQKFMLRESFLKEK
jgi:fatty-acyl-CoA synthase